MASSFGTGLGGMVHVLAGSLGVSAIVLASAEFFTALKLVGAAYLVWLGIRTFRAARRDASVNSAGAASPPAGPWRAFREGVVVEALNPKTAAFFLAFIPQFVDPAAGSVALQFEKVILVHGCRQVRDLACRSKLADELPADEILGDMVRDKFVYYPTITREPFKNRGRITDLIASGTLASDVGLPPISPQDDRFMLCGSMQMLPDIRGLLEGAGLNEGSTTVPGEFVVEKAFVE